MAEDAGARYGQGMTSRLRPPPHRAGAARMAVAVLALAALPGPARAVDAPGPPASARSEARLVAGRDEAGLHVAGLEIRLAPHFITYWRDPGDAGVPPTFSFAGSTNLGSASLRYPAPRRLDEAGAVAFGYTGAVTFPILVTPVDPAKPVELAVAVDYAICHEICLPAHAALRLSLDGRPSEAAEDVAAALAAVPRPSAVGASGTPAVAGVERDLDGGFAVAATGAEDGSALFVEAPEGWAYAVGAARRDGARAVFPVKRVEHPAGAERPPGPLTLTLVAPAGAVAVSVTLDGATAKP